jgi:hypothetical protein
MAPKDDDLTDPRFLIEIGDCLEGITPPEGHESLLEMITSDKGIPQYNQTSVVNGFHYMNLRKMAEAENTHKKLKSAKTKFEQEILTDVVSMMGYGPDWAAEMDTLYDNLKDHEWRERNATFLQPNYRDFVQLVSLVLTLRKNLKDKGDIKQMDSPSDRALWKNIQTFYYIIHPEQAQELVDLSKNLKEGTKPKNGNTRYQRLLPKSPETDIILMNLIHSIYEDGNFDPHEKTIFLPFVYHKMGYSEADLPYLTDRLGGRLVQQQLLMRDILKSASNAPVRLRETTIFDSDHLTEVEGMLSKITSFEKHIKDRYQLPHPEEIQLRDYVGKFIQGVIKDYDKLIKKNQKPFTVLTLCGPFEESFVNGLTSRRGLYLPDVAVVHAEDAEEFRYRLEANPSMVIIGSLVPSNKVGGSAGSYEGRGFIDYVRNKCNANIVMLNKLGETESRADLNISVAQKMGEEGLKKIREVLYKPTS